MLFKDRQDAGQKLAEKLIDYKDKSAVVYALPRGGVVVGFEIAKILNLPLDIVVTRKIGHPSNPEYAVCAVAADGHFICNEREIGSVDKQWLKAKFKLEQEEAQRREKVYRAGYEPISAKDKIAVIVDDGIATGLTLSLAIQEIKHQLPKEIVVAVPVSPADVARKIAGEVDRFVSVETTEVYLGAVGAYYQNFEQISDETVVKLIKENRKNV